MNFQPELAQAVLAGRKTVTRRMVSTNPRSPWYVGECGLRPGRTYAVCPGRGKPAVGRVRVLRADQQLLGRLDDAEARREGFPDAMAFYEAWGHMHGSYDPRARVWRVQFTLAL